MLSSGFEVFTTVAPVGEAGIEEVWMILGTNCLAGELGEETTAKHKT